MHLLFLLISLFININIFSSVESDMKFASDMVSAIQNYDINSIKKLLKNHDPLSMTEKLHLQTLARYMEKKINDKINGDDKAVFKIVSQGVIITVLAWYLIVKQAFSFLPILTALGLCGIIQFVFKSEDIDVQNSQNAHEITEILS